MKEKYRTVYDIYKNELPLFFEKFELEGFLPFTINAEYTGSINPFNLISERELSASEEELASTSDKEKQVLEKYDNELEGALNATLLKLSSNP